MIKKQYEKLEKQIEERKNLYHFMIRAKADDRLIGTAEVQADRVDEWQWFSATGHWRGGRSWQRLWHTGAADVAALCLRGVEFVPGECSGSRVQRSCHRTGEEIWLRPGSVPAQIA